jgi:L,D-peptidoglycan transpeptidase YkuD (ErfK/YbiS/YcfS/YnhG family)
LRAAQLQGSTYGVFRARPTAIRKTGPAPGTAPRKSTIDRSVPVLRVGALPGERGRGRVIAGSVVIRCALGPAGIRRTKREGDGATPTGKFRLEYALVRPDRLNRPHARLPIGRLRPDDGWCDDPRSPLYNKPVRRPFTRGHERLWRDDGLYDCVVVLDYNRHRVRKAQGSAIFLHVAAPDLTPTAGCVAVPRPALLRLLRRIGGRTRMVIA